MAEQPQFQSDFDLVRASVSLCSGLTVHAVAVPDLVRLIRLRMLSRVSTHVVTANPEIEQTVHDDPQYANAVRLSDVRTCDGVGVQVAARMSRQIVPPRATGVALTCALVDAAITEQWNVLVIGAADTVRERFEIQIRMRGAKVLTGSSLPVVSASETAETLAPLIQERTLVLLALGVPKQELVALQLKRRTRACAVYVGIGGAIDYLTGAVEYPPPLVRNCGLEWLYRLAKQPRKRLRRQLHSLPRFMLRETLSALLDSKRRLSP